MATLGELVKKHREKAGKTQVELAVEIGVSPSAIARLEQNKTNPEWFAMVAIAKALGVSLDVLARGTRAED